MTDLRKAAAAALGIGVDEIHTALVVGDELVVLTSALAKHRLPLAELVASDDAAESPKPKLRRKA